MRRDDRGVQLRQAMFASGAGPQNGARDGSAPAHPSSLDLAAILSSIGEVAYEWHIDTDALLWAPNAGEVLTIPDRNAIASGRGYARFLAPDTSMTPFDAVTQSGCQDDGRGVPYQLQYALHTPSGSPLWAEDTGRWFAGPTGRPLRAHGVVRIVNERHAHEQRLAYLSKYDELTGEMNRAHLSEVLGATLEEAHRHRTSSALLLVNIDNLARINEAYGFATADQVIAAVGKRLRTRLRGVDTLARFSGNKFALILKNCNSEEVPVAAERLLSAVRDEVVQTSTGPVAATATIAGVIVPRHARDVQEALTRAQETLEAAKRKRLGSFLAYRPSVEREALRLENVRATDRIVTALNERRILLAFEPVVDTVSRQPVFHECLMRIQRSDGVLIAAEAIMPVAERLGLVRLLDHRVLELVVAELVEFPHLRLSLNVSTASTVDPDWWASLGAHLRAHSGVAERLTVEITEMAEIHDIDETRGFVNRVKDLGCRIAIDDFGAGYTSFRNLRKLGVDIIKIDGAFVQNLIRSSDDSVFVRTVLDLGRSLGLTTVAEWVQDEESAAKLEEWGCDCLQGALVGLASVQRPWAAEPSEPDVQAGAA